MAWLGTRRRRRRSSRDEELIDPTGALPEVETATAEAKPLVLLVPEARKTAAFRLHTFAAVEGAAVFIQRWFRPGMSGGVIAFWALHRRPLIHPGNSEPEAIALVREDEGSDVVYFSSFKDMRSARSLVRAKVKRGLDLGLTLVYWAAPVAIDYRKPGAVHLTPAMPPPDQGGAVRGPPPLPQERDRREPESARLEQAPEPTGGPPEPSTLAFEGLEETAEVGEETTAIDAASEERADDDLEELEVSDEADAPPEPSAPAFDRFEEAADSADAWPEPSTAALNETEEVAAEADAPPEPSALAFEGLEETAEVSTDAPPEPWTQALDDPEEIDADAPSEPSALAFEGLEETAEASTDPDAIDTASEGQAGDQAEDEEEVEVVPTERLVFEVEKVLRVNRWHEREGPFRGFGSPPGKF